MESDLREEHEFPLVVHAPMPLSSLNAFPLPAGIRVRLRAWPRERVALAVLVTTYLILAIAFSLADPIFEPPDEHLHFAYVRYLVEHRHLPRLEEGELSEYHQPPLYYVLAAAIGGWLPAADFPQLLTLRNPFSRFDHPELSRNNKNLWLHGPWDAFPYRGSTLAIHLIRLLTVLTGLGAVWVTYRLASDVLCSPAAGLGAAAFVAFNPMFLLLAGAVHNDPLIAFEGGALLWACVGVVRGNLSLRRALLVGALIGLTWLTKVTSIFLLPAVELAISWAAWRRRSPRDWLRFNVVVAATALVVGGWLFFRNLGVYGDPTAVGADLTIWGSRKPVDSLPVLGGELFFAWTSFWGRFGYSQVPLPEPIYLALTGVGLAALAGFGVWVVRAARRRPGLMPAVPEVAVLCTASLSLVAALVGYILFSPAGMFGRYTFPALAASATLLFFGLSRLFPPRYTARLALASGVGMGSLATIALVLYLTRIYAPPPLLPAAMLAAIPHRVNANFGNVAQLLGYDVPVARVRPGGRIPVTLYWQALARAPENYVVFVHLANGDDLIAAQVDTHPGLGTYPTGAWTPGRTFADTYDVDVPATAYAPDSTYLEVGLYNRATGQRLPVTGAASDVPGDALRLTSLPVDPQPGDLPNPVRVNFDNQLELAGYRLDRRTAAPDETIRLTLYWRVLQPPAHNLVTFVHVIGPENKIWASGDGRPQAGHGRTSTWTPGAVVEDVRELRVYGSTPPGLYDLELGWFDPRDEGDRLRVRKPDGKPGESRVLLPDVRVTPR